ncbi:ribosome maturation factor RimP [Clostridium homopropionicum DSM 5847]|uniref:Ribosome maturation factor RimP n=1 Tax=Clostridium homopropionicum DSM 5847 TaxID=1121318 RepID=A0A0L6ZDK1_9CLOT|nr:ribosome maturation factor RimP [Clostridium homopropionicum]KOA20873.1 ribosome maturation factor RimP [Clostridium homopropionicum DSM 5847]SFG03157.1 ribosome maturation factor RimP [Clostridium homopropionicum]
MQNNIIVDRLTELIEPIVLSLNYELYYLEYIKEQNEYYLRAYIDKPEGISLEDCEKVSRKISEMLDEKDPISDAYYLEVSSPGIERILYNDKHLKKYLNNAVIVKLAKLVNGKRVYEGNLLSFDENSVSIETEGLNLIIERNKIKKIILKGEF